MNLRVSEHESELIENDGILSCSQNSKPSLVVISDGACRDDTLI